MHRCGMKRIVASSIAIAAILMSLVAPIRAQENYIRTTEVIDTPTAFTLEKGNYHLSFLGYDNGGLAFKTYMGLNDNIYLGAAFDVQNAIGRERAQPNVPGIVAKIKFTDGWEQFPISFAVGYDTFYIGNDGKTRNEQNELNQMIYGPYFVVTKPIYLFDDEQHVNFGMRVPTQPYYVPDNASYFISIDVPMGEYFMFKAEGERIYYDFTRPNEWLLNFGIRYTYMRHFSIEFDIILQSGEQGNRILKIEYTDHF